MNSTTPLMLVALVAIVGTIGFASEAHAEHGDHNLPLTVQTDSATYGHDDTITVTGQVANVIPGNVPITVTVVSPMTSLVTIGLATCDIDEGSIIFDGEELIHKTPEKTEKTLSILKYFSSFFTIGLLLCLFWTFFAPIQGLQASAVMLIAFTISFVSRRIIDAPRSRHEKFMRSIRGNKISMIFQEPMTALNPLYTVEKQVSEVLKQHGRLDNAETSQTSG